MQRKPGFPVVNCSIKMPDTVLPSESVQTEDDGEQRRQQLINFGHVQWGFNNWNWSVSKQELDFVDLSNGKYTAGVVAFVSVSVKSFDIHRENIGYATSVANSKGMAIYMSRKCAVTNALRETLLSFGGSVAAELMELLDHHKSEYSVPAAAAPPDPLPENNQNLANVQPERKNSPVMTTRKDSIDSNCSAANSVRPPLPLVPPTIKNTVVVNPRPPVAKAQPMPGELPPAANRAPPACFPHLPAPPPPCAPPPPAAGLRPNSNEARPPSPKPPEAAPSDEEARAERKRRQRQAQEEFRQKQMMKHNAGPDEKPELQKTSTSFFEKLLLDIPTQDTVIEETNETEAGKRKSPVHTGSASKRRGSVMRLDIVSD